MFLLFIGRPTLCFAVNEILSLLNCHENFRPYFGCSTILQVTLFYRPLFTVFSLLYDLCLKRKKCFVSLLYDLPSEGKTFSLLNDLSLEGRNCFVAV